MRAPTICLAVAWGGLLLGACGDDEEQALTRQEFIKRADTICRRFDRAANRVVDKHLSPLGPQRQPSAEQIDALLDDLAPLVRQETRALRALPAPKEDEKFLEDLFDDIDAAVAEARANRRNPPGTGRTAPEVFDEVNRRVAEYGFQDCIAEEE